METGHKYLSATPPIQNSESENTQKVLRIKKNLQINNNQRSLRILHIGNIANNAYLAARSEREVGLESHVISNDYTHIMGSPEWEHCKVSREESDHFSEDFSDCTCEFVRPAWFHSGSMATAALSLQNAISAESTSEIVGNPIGFNSPARKIREGLSRAVSVLWQVCRPIGRKVVPIKYRASLIGFLIHRLRKATQLDMTTIFDQFDVVNLYGSSPHLIANLNLSSQSRNKFTATEHGTLRDYIFAKYPLSKDTKSGYERSKVIFVTNQDCLPIAEAMKTPKVIRMPHPINDELLFNYRNMRKTNLSKPLFNVIVPSRHSYSLDIDRGKGNEKVYEVIKTMANLELPIQFTLIAWGDNVKGARQLLKSEEDQGVVKWINVLSRPLLKELMAESLCLLDQFKIEAYGAVTVDGIGVGLPVITAHSCENDKAYFGSCAPVLPAKTAPEIQEHILLLYNASIKDRVKAFDESCDWYDNNLSEQISLSRRLEGYLLTFKENWER